VAGLGAEAHVTIDDFSVVALLGLEVEQACLVVSEAVKGCLQQNWNTGCRLWTVNHSSRAGQD